MVNYIKYKGKFWKIVSNKNGRYYLVPKKVNSNYKKKFRTYKNIEKFGFSKNFRKVIKNRRKRNLLKGGAKDDEFPEEPSRVRDPDALLSFRDLKTWNANKVPLQKENQYITKDDRKWINEIPNPRDREIANKSLNDLNKINNLMKIFGGNELSFSNLGEATEYLKNNKEQVLQYITDNAAGTSVGHTLLEGLKLFGNKLLSFIGINTGANRQSEFSEAAMANASKALDELISNLKTKSLTATQTLQQIYLKQGDREEAKQIREDEEKKQDQYRKEDRYTSTPKYQVIRNLNPLGYETGQSQRKVDPENLEQVRNVRQNPILKQLDPAYLPQSQKGPMNQFQKKDSDNLNSKTQSSWQ